MMYLLFAVYSILLVYYTARSSKKGAFYMFSPLITIYVPFAFYNIYPLLTYDGYLPHNIVNVTIITCIINTFFLIYGNKLWRKKINFKINIALLKYSRNRMIVFVLFLFLIMLSGIISGVTPALARGADVEDLRRTSEIGLGFIRNIPAFGLPILLLEMLLLKKHTITHVAITCIIIGSLFFLATAARGDLLTFIIIFFVWFNLKHRSLKWYEYFLVFYLAKPIFATLLFLIRSAQGLTFGDFTLFEHEKSIFASNTVKLAEWIQNSNLYLYGYSYFYDLVSIIPRFLWPDKPKSIDYYYKNAVGLDFEGGGIYTSRDFDLFLNFGYYYIIPYVLWLLFIHKMYNRVITGANTFSVNMFFIVTLACAIDVGSLISRFELFGLLLVLFFYVNKKWKVL